MPQDHIPDDTSEATEPDGHGDDPSTARTVVGKVTEALGWATADRKVEARGKLAQLDAEDPDATDDEQDAVLEQAETHVRSDHGDLAPRAEPSRTEQPVKANPKEGG